MTVCKHKKFVLLIYYLDLRQQAKNLIRGSEKVLSSIYFPALLLKLQLFEGNFFVDKIKYQSSIGSKALVYSNLHIQ